MFIKPTISFARNAVIKYKAQRIKSVVDSYIGLADAQVVMIVPAVMEFYRRTAHVIVDKTYENPEPAAQLLEALDNAVKHYGPALIAEFEAFSAEHAKRSNSIVVTSRLEQLLQTINDLTTDVSNDGDAKDKAS